MKIGKKELAMLCAALGVIFLVAAILFGNNLATQTETLEAENETLAQEVAYLQDLKDHEEEYLAESARMNQEMEEIKEQFPAGIRPETQIMYSNGLESRFDVLIENIDMPGTNVVYVENTATAPVADTTAATEDTLDEGADASADTSASAGNAIASAATSIVLYNSPTSIDFLSSYKGIKDTIRYINEDHDRKSIEGFTLSLNTETGNLQGTIDVNMYALDGTGKEYQAPVVTGVTDGKNQIISGGTVLNRSTANKSGDTATADGKAEESANDADAQEE